MSRRSLPRWLAGPALAALAAVTVVGACTSPEVAPLPPPKPLPETTTTTTIDFSLIGLAGVPGRTTTTVVMGPGKAGLIGTVYGPEGVVPGALVRIERLVGDGAASIDLTATPEGTYAVPEVLGGRYRVRAWKPAPDNLALVEPLVFFLEGAEQRVVDLTLARYQGVSVTSAMAPDPPVLGAGANLVLQVVDQQVDPEGVVRSNPMTGAAVELYGPGDWRIVSANPATVDGKGRATWLLECRRVGVQPLSVLVGGALAFNLPLPACVAPPATAGEGTAPPSPSPSPTPTTRPPSPATTARPAPTTTRPPATTAKPPSTTVAPTTTRAGRPPTTTAP
ncbi:MAG TPA: carboxypeptidase-like regulatory domain-containing protein [Acidimicrobiales bacterium]|nr:carboxypeptidase-like regulatory domain-containing protein [Acidimicrobiales bacterium]